MGSLTHYGLGQFGVNVDKSPLHIDDGELTAAQNAVRDQKGIDGGLVKRPGLVKHNTSAGAGSMLGGIGLPLGTGNTGTADSVTIYFSVGTGDFSSWVTSNDLFTTSTTLTNDLPLEYMRFAGDVDGAGTVLSNLVDNIRSGLIFNKRIYYAAKDYTVGTTSPTIHISDGITDYVLARVLPATTMGVATMVVDHATIYLSTLDSGSSDADWVGRIFSMNASTGGLTPIGTAIATGYAPTALAVHNGRIFVGASKQTSTAEARIYQLNLLDETTWTLEDTLPADRYAITSFGRFQGLLYATTTSRAVAATFGTVRKRAIAGTWSTVDSTVDTGGSYNDLRVFNGFLYTCATNYSSGSSVVRRSADGSSWATVFTGTGNGPITQLFVIGSRIFALSGGDGTRINYSSNGTSWTTKSLSIGSNDVLFGVFGPIS